MSIVKKAPGIMTREVRLEEPVNELLEDYARFTGKALSHKANLIASKSYNTQSDYRFDMKTFMELRNAQSVVIAYDGINPTPPMFCYLKPYYNNPNESYFVQLAKGTL